MSDYAIGSYIEFTDWEGNPVGLNFQNFHRNESRSFDGATYMPAEFGFSGSVGSLEGADVTSELVFATSDLMLSTAKQAADEFWLVNVRTVWLDPDTLAEGSIYSEEIFSVQSFANDLQRVIMTLGSPLDAFTAEVPRRILSRVAVGSLPSTGNVPLI